MKKAVGLLVFFLVLFGFAKVALAASSNELDYLSVDGDSIEIEDVMYAEIGDNLTEIEIDAYPEYAEAQLTLSVENGTIAAIDSNTEVNYLLNLSKSNDICVVYITIKPDSLQREKVYMLIIYREGADIEEEALLGELVVNSNPGKSTKGVILLGDSDFIPGQLDYHIEIDPLDNITSLYLWLEPLFDDCSIYVDRTLLDEDEYDGYEIKLPTAKGEFSVEIEIEANDEANTYVLNIDNTGISSDNSSSEQSLADLSASSRQSSSSRYQYPLYPQFDPSISDYYVFLADGISEAYLYLEPQDEDYSVYCQNSLVSGDDDYYAYLDNIDDGDEIEICVENERGKELDIYTVTFFCGDEDDDDNSYLDCLSMQSKIAASIYSNISLNQVFTQDTVNYSANVPTNPFNMVRIYAEAEDNGAHVLINGAVVANNGYLDLLVKAGVNTFTVVVYAENCDDTRTYTLVINYGGGITDSDIAGKLSSLQLKGDTGVVVNVYPSFSGDKLNYTTNAAGNINSIAINPGGLLADNIFINGIRVTANTWSNYIPMNGGNNTISIQVQDSAGSAYRSYNICIYRHPTAIKTVISNQKLMVNGINQNIYAYNINGNNFVKLRDIAFLLQNTNKKFSVNYVGATNNVYIGTNSAYVTSHTENTPLDIPKSVIATKQSLYLDNLLVEPMAFNIDGSNFVLLRDICLLLDCGVTYDYTTNAIQIFTANAYAPQ